ncbi:putative glycosyl hydrolases family 17 protein 2 [Elsinoe fawcettii]|nr:putative glycosyl hydrolases family 17 protein 2 [Elsinoe fawcettii]
MKLLTPTVFALLTAFLPSASAALRGFNFAANNQDGSCKTIDQWKDAFTRMKKSPGPFNAARLYASSDCNTLANAVPAAMALKTKILVGVWTQDDNHFNAEKQALLNAIRDFGSSWIVAVSVGSEDLYRKEADPNVLAQKIYDVRGMINAQGVYVPVGHVDTWTAWVDPANDVVTKACDFVGLDGYPYFEAARIDQAAKVFMKSVRRTRSHTGSVKPGIQVWVTETGWPVSGETFGGQAVASAQNAQSYWRALVCSGKLKDVNLFWYVESDSWMTPSFGMTGSDGKRLYNKGKC